MPILRLFSWFFVHRVVPISFLSVMLSALMFSSPSIAQNCFSDSPSKNSGQAITSEITARDLTATEYNDLKKFFTSLKGKWSGTVEETVCRGQIGAITTEVHQYSVEPEISINRSEELIMNSIWQSSKRKTSRIENLNLFLTRKRLRLDKDAPGGDVELIKVSNSFLVFLDKKNLRNAAGGVLTQEIVRSFSLSGKALTIEYKLYTNGLLASFSLWELTH